MWRLARGKGRTVAFSRQHHSAQAQQMMVLPLNAHTEVCLCCVVLRAVSCCGALCPCRAVMLCCRAVSSCSLVS